MSRSDVGPSKTLPMDRRPTSPLLSESGLRSAAESYLHFRTHSRSGSTHSASDATPTPSASALRRAQAIAAGDSPATPSGSKLSSLLHNLQPSSRMGSTSHLAQPPMRSHSRSDSGLASAGSGAASPLPSHAKMTPNAASSTLRAPYGGPGSMTSYNSGGSLVSSGGSTTVGSAAGGEKDNAWGALHVHVLPLFNSEPLKVPIEDLNNLVKKHMGSVIARNPGKAVSQLEADVSELIGAGMVTLNSKLAAGVQDEKLAGRIVDLWSYFWDQILPYVEGVFLPLQTDPYLYSLSRPAKPSSSHHGDLGAASNNLSGAPSIDVRTLALRAFRDSVVLPVAPRLQKRFSAPNRDKDLNSDLAVHHRPRLEQMLLVLSQLPPYTVSLTSTTENTQPTTAGERAITTLLRLVIYPPGTQPTEVGPSAPRLPSFLSSGAPRDRRGRLARKSLQVKVKNPSGDFDDRLAMGGLLSAELLGSMSGGGSGGPGGREDNDREREGRELLDSLRSPNLELSAENAEHGVGMGSDGEVDDDGGMGTVMPNDAMESLGTGPGGWGASGGGGTARPVGVVGAVEQNGAGRRAAIYDDEVYEDGEGPHYAAAVRNSEPRRPSRGGAEGEKEAPAAPVERKLRI